MMESARVRNERLRALLVEAGWSGAELARTINYVAVETGLRLEYKRASVAQWLSGGQPRSPVPDLVVEALSRRLNREVTTIEAGMNSALGGHADAESAGVEAWRGPLVDIAGRHHRDTVGHCVYRVAALSVPGRDGTSTTVSIPIQRSGAQVRVGAPEVDAARMMLRVFSDAEIAFGAGHIRPALADYLANTILPWTDARSANPEIRRELFSVAAQLTYLAGFLCFDDEYHGAAQRYYRAALELFTEAADTAGYAITLRAMSVQARLLGHHRHAVTLAEAATGTASTRVSPVTRAFLLGQSAVASAAAGDRVLATAHLLAAERHLELAGDEVVTVGAYHPSALAHQRAAVLRCLGDGDGAISALKESLRCRPAGEHRARALTSARLAELQIGQGQVAEAVATWHRFLDVYPMVRSGRVRTALVVLRARSRPHQQSPSVRNLLDRVAVVSRQVATR
jgi:tetratricopeptide (TPR) repeat protein